MLEIGTKAPAFTLPDKDGNLVSLSDFAGKKTVLYFYPPDRKTLFGNVVKKCIQCSRTSEKRNNIVKKFKYSASYFELYTKFTPNEKDFRCGFQISYEP